MRYLITGGAGFIGSNICERLLNDRDNEVCVLDNLATGKRENIEFLKQIRDFEFIEGDIRSYHIVRKAMENVDYVLHQAALPSIPRSINDPITTNDVNIQGTLNVLEAAKDAKVKRVVFASSSSVYGDTVEMPKVETMRINPLNPYALSKYTGERYCQLFYELYGLETVALRYFNVFGPRQDHRSQYSAVIPKFINFIKNGKTIKIYGDGDQSRDFTYIDNVVQANIKAATTDTIGGRVFNIACGDRFTVNKLVSVIEEFSSEKAKAEYVLPRPGEIKHSLASIDLAKEKFGYDPKISFIEGVRKTVEYNMK